jgi:hypothetical protein
MRQLKPLGLKLKMQRAGAAGQGGVRGAGAATEDEFTDDDDIPVVPPVECVPFVLSLIPGYLTGSPLEFEALQFCEGFYRVQMLDTDFIVVADAVLCDRVPTFGVVDDISETFDSTESTFEGKPTVEFHRASSTPQLAEGGTITVQLRGDGEAIGDPLVVHVADIPEGHAVLYYQGTVITVNNVVEFDGPLSSVASDYLLEYRGQAHCGELTAIFQAPDSGATVHTVGDVGSYSGSSNAGANPFTVVWDLRNDTLPYPFVRYEQGGDPGLGAIFAANILIGGSPTFDTGGVQMVGYAILLQRP